MGHGYRGEGQGRGSDGLGMGLGVRTLGSSRTCEFEMVGNGFSLVRG